MNKKNKRLLAKMNNEKRRSSLEKIKRKKRRELILIVTLFLIVIAVFSLLFSNYLKLKTIEVEGNNQITKEEILEAGNINNNLRTWSIKDDEIRNNIQSRFEIFKSVTVQSKLPSTIKVKVEEYSFIAQNKKEDGSLEIIMENGKPYSGKVRNNYNLPILENFKDDRSKLDEVYKNLNKLKEDVRLQISEIINDEGDNVTIYMKDGQKVKALRASFSDKLNYYDEISKYIEDKNNTTLNLINGAYLETAKTEKRRNENIKQLLSRQGLKDDSTSKTDKEKVDDTEKVEKNNKAENSTTNSKVVSSTNNKNTKQQSVINNKNE
ncbi:cell division protein FtsQ/DivIB [Gemella haemolysans]|uniref:POTRA domain protein, FtsQ-type n=1 Tax=Gemella haemolysans ATCC 10379 TaxID=546270 RepID=C5NU67_9BACL|nr:FtsQ-type POTRA domain-containing protein [Gemella haemolysans]EER69254.1 POTRA domain protein, FtsQ-type [Gemella haemolysans ATCC 10379]KAA8706460.1 FtsQ-type POTRA domain-containing protein [Gemella haemolysans]UBH81658.1 FtsQ-type POTRA domain-containing protein [Gemella haemolysans]VEI38435.1 Division initiation protein DivIB [Gemella haemolysans]